MKYEWRKKEKETYLPKNTPAMHIGIERMYITVEGEGHPGSDAFRSKIELLYALSYSIRMMLKSGVTPNGYFEYTVFPLEGIWDLNEEGRKLDYLNKNHFVYRLMIRQPDFMTEELFQAAIENVSAKKKHLAVESAKFERISDGLCVQMMHLGSYNDEPETFSIMEKYCDVHELTRIDRTHKEIYISNASKTAPEKLQTVIRFKVSKQN